MGTFLSPQALAAAIAVAAVVLGAMILVARSARPKHQHFRCARCGTVAAHTNRTIQAWRNKQQKFYCQTCHLRWLESQPHQPKVQREARGGCLGVVLLFVIVPIGAALVWAHA